MRCAPRPKRSLGVDLTAVPWSEDAHKDDHAEETSADRQQHEPHPTSPRSLDLLGEHVVGRGLFLDAAVCPSRR